VKTCNQLVKKVKKMWFLRQDPRWSDLILEKGQSILEKGQKRTKGQTKLLGPASVIWDQMHEIWPQIGPTWWPWPGMCSGRMNEATVPEIQGSGSSTEWNYKKCIYQNLVT